MVQADSDARLAMVALTWHNGDVEVAETCLRILCGLVLTSFRDASRFLCRFPLCADPCL